jgi:hypothetical protein
VEFFEPFSLVRVPFSCDCGLSESEGSWHDCKNPDDRTLRNMPQTPELGIRSGLEMQEYSIPRKPVGSVGTQNTQETSPLVGTDDCRAQSPTSTLNPRYDEEPHSHYYEKSGTCCQSTRPKSESLSISYFESAHTALSQAKKAAHNPWHYPQCVTDAVTQIPDAPHESPGASVPCRKDGRRVIMIIRLTNWVIKTWTKAT